MKKAKYLRRPAASTAPMKRRELGREPTWKDRFRYRFDATLARGTYAVILWLAAVTGAIVLLAGIVVFFVHRPFVPGDDDTLGEGVWQSMLRVIDPGTMAGDRGWTSRVLALTITIVGLLLASALIGLIATAIDQRIEQLRKGRSFVVENGHTLILGWSPRVFTILSEIQVANENQPGSCITVLAGVDKTEMEDEIRARVPSHKATHIVCRTGDPATLADLSMVNASKARSVVILGDESSGGDAEVVKAALAVMAGDLGDDVPVVAELTREDASAALRDASGGRVLTVRSSDIIARVTAQACREAGLSAVFQELLDFDGDEIYFQPAPELEGLTFGDALLAYDSSTILGRRTAGGVVQINPPMGTRFEAGDSVIAVSEDDDTIVFTGVQEVEPPQVSLGDAVAAPEHLLFIGWNPLGPMVLAQLDRFVAAGSSVDVYVEPSFVDRASLDSMYGTTGMDFAHLSAAFHDVRTEVAGLRQAMRAKRYDSVVVLGYRHNVTTAEADARTLLSLMVLDRALKENDQRPRVVAELLDVRDVELAQVTGGDDYVVSDALGSLMMAQLAEHAELGAVFDGLFGADGAAIHIRPVAGYVAEGPITYAQLVAAARAKGEVALGYRSAGADDGALAGGVVVNPPKDRGLSLTADDQVIVISGSESVAV